MRILLVSDTTLPHVCGVSRKIGHIQEHLESLGHEIRVIGPFQFFKIMFFSFPVGFPNLITAYNMINDYSPDIVCLMTEGPVGFVFKLCCMLQSRKYMTMYTTRLPEYSRLYGQLIFMGPLFHFLTLSYMNWFHCSSELIITPSESMKNILVNRNPFLKNRIKCILNGCDTSQFNHLGSDFPELRAYSDAKPLWLYVGRVSIEKNLRDFLNLDLDGTKVVVGDGAELNNLREEYQKNSNIVFMGLRYGEELYQIYRSCDIFVFPSRTETFGQTMVEAMASGLPVAAYPVPGPLDVVVHGKTGYLHEDLSEACRQSLKLLKQNPDTIKDTCHQHAQTFKWKNMCDSMIDSIQQTRSLCSS